MLTFRLDSSYLGWRKEGYSHFSLLYTRCCLWRHQLSAGQPIPGRPHGAAFNRDLSIPLPMTTLSHDRSLQGLPATSPWPGYGRGLGRDR